MEGKPEYDYLFKIIILGDSGIGKTSIMRRYTDNVFDLENEATIGVDFKIKTKEIDGKIVKLQIWDTAGQERFRTIVQSYYRGADGVLLAFDAQDERSFNNLDSWWSELGRNGVLENSEMLILGNKCDNDDLIKVDDEKVYDFLKMKDKNSDCFLRVSAKNNLNVEDSFERLAVRLMKKTGTQNFKPINRTFRKGKHMEKKGCC